jgi:hypothetical protein
MSSHEVTKEHEPWQNSPTRNLRAHEVWEEI